MRAYFVIFILICCLAAGNAAAAVLQPGFRTLGTYSQEPAARIDLNIWYPAQRQPQELNYSQWKIKGALNAKAVNGKFPLLVLSHPTPGTRFSYHELAAFLAKSGFVVVAPTHEHDNLDNMDNFFTWNQFAERVEEINRIINLVFEEKTIGEHIDKNKIGYIGFGSGATAGLLLGGAIPNCAAWPQYCAQAGLRDIYCNGWAKEKMEALCAALPDAAGFANNEIRAMALIAPVLGMLFNHNSFDNYYPPTLFVGAARESSPPAEAHCGYLATLAGHKAQCLEIPSVRTGALMSPCPEFLAAELPELCQQADEKIALTARSLLQDALLSFFGKQFFTSPTGSSEP